MDLNLTPHAALCVLKILDRNYNKINSNEPKLYSTYANFSSIDLNGKLCSDRKLFRLSEITYYDNELIISLSPFMSAVLTRQFKLAENMFNMGVNIDATNQYNQNALLLATSLGDIETITWCSGFFNEEQWLKKLGSYDPYQEDIPILRLERHSPELASFVKSKWKNTEKKPNVK